MSGWNGRGDGSPSKERVPSHTLGWTGAQYSTYRAFLALTIFVRARAFLPPLQEAPQRPVRNTIGLSEYLPNVLHIAGDPFVVALAVAASVALASLVLFGFRDRIASLPLAYLLLCVDLQATGTIERDVFVLALLLVLHAWAPRAPYGSWERRTRADPGASWRKPDALQRAGWIALSCEAVFLGAPIMLDAISTRAPTIAAAYAALRLAGVALVVASKLAAWIAHAAALSLAIASGLEGGEGAAALLLVFAFDPAWIPASPRRPIETLFYDGGCGLCHRTLRFLISEDREGDRFRFAPLGGETFLRRVPEEARRALPDSFVVEAHGGALLVRSEAAVHVLRRLGGFWRVAGVLLSLIPKRLVDGVYDGVARVRHRVFPRPSSVCPIVPDDLRSRFEA